MMEAMASTVRKPEIEAESRRDEISTEKARRAAPIYAYIAAFIGAVQEFSPELEEASIECWLDQERVDDDKR